MADVKYLITADAKGAVKEIGNLEGSLGKMKTQAQKSIGPLKGMFKKIALGVGGVMALRSAFQGLTRFMGDAVEKAKAQEAAEKALVDALRSTGREVPVNADHFKRYAQELQNATVYGDEQILNAQALMIQLTDLDRQGLDVATKGALGLATVFKTDLKAATTLVAKALAGNYGALSRYGISVADLNTDEEKRASILKQLQTLYERAKGEVDTFEGAISQLRNSYGDLKEAIGDSIIKNEDLVKSFKDIKTWIDKNRDSIGLYFSALIEATKESIVFIGKLAGKIASLADVVGASDEEWRAFIASQQSAYGIMQDGINVMELKKTAMEEGIITAGEWAETWKKYGYNYQEMMRAIAEGKEGDDFKQLLDDLKKKQEDLAAALENKTRPAVSTTTSLLKTAALASTAFTTEVAGCVGKVIDLKDVLEQAKPVLKTTFQEALPPARDLSGVLDQVQENFEDVVDQSKTTTDDIATHWSDLASEIRESFGYQYMEGIIDAFGDCFESILTKGSDMADAIDTLFNSLVDNIRTLLRNWLTDFLKQNVFDAMLQQAKSAASGIASEMKKVGDAIKGATGGAAGAAGAAAGATPWGAVATGVGAFAGTLLGNLLGGKGGFQGADSQHLKETAMHTRQLLDFFLIDVRKYIIQQGWGIKFGLLLDKEDAGNKALFKIHANTKSLVDTFKNVKFAQHGFEGIVQRPTMFMAGERGPERVSIQPNVNANLNVRLTPLVVPIQLDGKILAKAIIRYYPELSKSGYMKIHPRAIVSY